MDGNHLWVLETNILLDLCLHQSMISRRNLLRVATVLLAANSGCLSRFHRPDVSDQSLVESDVSQRQAVGDLTRVWGIQPIRVEGVSLVVGLVGTGSNPPPSEQLDLLVSEMRTRQVDGTAQILASPDTAQVSVSAVIPPGAQRGDPLDVSVCVPPGSSTSSLSGGWLMETRLLEYARIKKQLAKGHLFGLARGSVLVDAHVEGDDDPISRTRGRVLGGGRVAKDRLLGLTIREESLSVQTSVRVGKAINARFHVYDRGRKTGVATPKRDNFVEIAVHPRYRDNLMRYMRVVQAISVREGESGIVSRMELLGRLLVQVPTAADAAIQLEAIGLEGVSTLQKGLTSSNPEVRFYAAEALAYLDDPMATPVLAAVAKSEPAFRWRALTALSAMEATKAFDKLEELLHSDSVETRYGAFRAIQSISDDDPAVSGEYLGKKFHFHDLSTEGPAVVHVALDHRPEIVLFGGEHQLQHPVFLYAGSRIVVRSADDDGLAVTSVSAGEQDKQKRCSTRLDDVIRTVVDFGAEYADVVELLYNAKKNESLKAKLAFGALPEVGRTYYRGKHNDAGEDVPNGDGQFAISGTQLEQADIMRAQPSLKKVSDPLDLPFTKVPEGADADGGESVGSGVFAVPSAGQK